MIHSRPPMKSPKSLIIQMLRAVDNRYRRSRDTLFGPHVETPIRGYDGQIVDYAEVRAWRPGSIIESRDGRTRYLVSRVAGGVLIRLGEKIPFRTRRKLRRQAARDRRALRALEGGSELLGY